MNKFLILLFSLSLGFAMSCKTKKLAVKPEEKPVVKEEKGVSAYEVLFARVISSKNNSPALSFSANADYNDGKQSAELGMEVMAKKDQYIFMNVKALGFVNVARVMIQPDSIRIIDLIHRTYISASYRYMKNYSNAPIGFEQLQNMVWGNAMFDPILGQTQADSLQQILKLITEISGARQIAVYTAGLKTKSVALTEQGKAQEMLVDFDDFKFVDGMNYPHSIVIHIQGEKKVECKFTISNFAGIIKKEPQFVVPKSYKVQVY